MRQSKGRMDGFVSGELSLDIPQSRVSGNRKRDNDIRFFIT